MDVVVTGSTGLIGEALVTALESAGHTPIRAVRGEAPDERASLRWSPAEGTIEAGALEGVDAVVNLAGAGIADERWTDERKQLVLDSRVDSTRLLTETLTGLTTPPSVLINGSAIGYYGDRGDDTLTESSVAGTGFLADVCRSWEAAAAPAADAGVRVALIRTGVVLSASGGALAEQLPFFKLGLGGRIGDGRQYWSWISIDDVVGALLWLLERPVAGPVNLTAPEPVRQKELAKAIGRALGRPTFLPTPKLALNLRLGAELAEALLLTSAFVLPEALLDSGFEFSQPTIDEALGALLD